VGLSSNADGLSVAELVRVRNLQKPKSHDIGYWWLANAKLAKDRHG